ncbi:hypothetical protein [Aureispira anguillae]|uniref:Uncharacterized protein n=1 Tax=Aureispira anguillae TaxID=2864201 RepID=A0A915VKJ0_9BACT|nr:hypothetical protein [Aureispira anguillae]BDS09717.1 hypothetical protein AsAng_0004220 [Aureispira anguillae]
MPTKYSFLLLLILLAHQYTVAQNTNPFSSLRTKFQLVDFNLLHVYTDGPQETGNYSAQSIYPFKGSLLEPQLVLLLEQHLTLDTEDKTYFASYRYPITEAQEVLILRVYDQAMQQNVIYGLVYNHQSQQFIQTIELATDYYAEGGNGATQSWLTQLDQNTSKDILTRTYYETYQADKDDPEEFKRIFKDQVYLQIWDVANFKKITVTDLELKKCLQKQFHYLPATGIVLDDATQQSLEQWLKKH